MKKVIVCLLGVFLLSQPTYAHNLANVIEQVLPSVTYIEVERNIVKKRVDAATKSIIEVREKASPSAGTGFVIEGNLIVTNYHVISRSIRDGEKVYVKFNNNHGVRYEATIIGYDEVADVALLGIEGKHPSLEIATGTEDMRMGDDVFTISNYYSIRHSATQGIVSSNDRVDSRYPFIRLLQLQVLQGSGSSGGPVLNDKGQVVALNHKILSMVPGDVFKSPSPSLMSMTAFTIRGDELAHSIEEIKKYGVVKRMDLGLFLRPYGMNTERYLYDPVPNSEDVSGVLVLGVDKDGPEQFRPNDIIVEIEGKHFTSAAELLMWLDANKQEGDTVKIQLYRDGAMLNITTKIKVAHRS